MYVDVCIASAKEQINIVELSWVRGQELSDIVNNAKPSPNVIHVIRRIR